MKPKNGVREVDNAFNCLDLASWIIYFLNFKPFLLISPLILCMEGLVSCIAGQHFFLKGFNLVFGLLVAPVNYRVSCILWMSLYNYFKFVSLLEDQFSPILALSYVGLSLWELLFVARSYAVAGFKFYVTTTNLNFFNIFLSTVTKKY